MIRFSKTEIEIFEIYSTAKNLKLTKKLFAPFGVTTKKILKLYKDAHDCEELFSKYANSEEENEKILENYLNKNLTIYYLI